jgi:hypothetical protein
MQPNIEEKVESGVGCDKRMEQTLKVDAMRSLNRLTAIAVKKFPAGKYADGGGLWLFKREDESGNWFLSYTIHGRRREMGLGAISEVSLKEARENADRWRAVFRRGAGRD